MALTGKKKVFADAILAGDTNKNAAIRAGYSAATASAAGSRLVKDPAVVGFLATSRAAKPKTAKSKTADVAPADQPASGGAKFDLAAAMQHTDPKAFLTAAMNDMELDPKQRIIAARALMPFVHGKVADQGKKDSEKDAAKEAGKGKFSPGEPPKLRSVGH